MPKGLVAELDRGTWSPAPVFAMIAQRGRVERAEMEQTFNMGVGMVAVVAPESFAVKKSVPGAGIAKDVIARNFAEPAPGAAVPMRSDVLHLLSMQDRRVVFVDVVEAVQ